MAAGPNHDRPTRLADNPAAASRVTGAAFWSLMDRWGIPDRQALALIDHPPAASEKRPRFALTTDQARRLTLLREIGMIAAELYGEAGPWIRARNRAAPFRGQTPAAAMAKNGIRGIEATLAHLQQTAMRASLRRRG